MLRRFLPFFVAAALTTVLVFSSVSQHRSLSWRRVQQFVGLGELGPTEEQIKSGHNILPDLRTTQADSAYPEPSDDTLRGLGRNWQVFTEPKIEDGSPYPKGRTKPAGSNYTKGLVIPRLKHEDTSWIESELSDMLDNDLLHPYVYVVNDPSAPLHPPKNKGHEVSVYLSYIIDHYDSLPDISIFMHAHRFTWHNNILLNTDASEMVRWLSAERVTREGYMNLRCHWDPGCPTWLHPGAITKNKDKKEEVILADCWSELFPMDPIPTVLAQPCCAQFAVSRERIQETAKMRYIYMRDWVLRTSLDDYLSGRVFEYVWQFIFSKTAIHCPSMAACYCDGYGLCFGSPEKFDEWFKVRYDRNELKEELRVWNEKADLVQQWRDSAKEGKMVEEARLEVPEVGKDTELKNRIAALDDELEKRRQEAFQRGQDPKQRASESGRHWTIGDGF